MKNRGIALVRCLLSAPLVAFGLAVAPVASQAETGPYNWQLNPNNGHYYKLFDCTKISLCAYQARLDGGHLVTIAGQEEQDWLNTTFQIWGTYWIGINDIKREGKFVWATGEPLDFTDWANGEPNNFEEGQDCVLTISEPYNDDWVSEWDDVSCDGATGLAIFEREDAPEPEISGSMVAPERYTVNCTNLRSGQSVSQSFARKETTWSCRALGLETRPGDAFSVTIEGRFN